MGYFTIKKLKIGQINQMKIVINRIKKKIKAEEK
jgi:hypothetical protein